MVEGGALTVEHVVPKRGTSSDGRKSRSIPRGRDRPKCQGLSAAAENAQRRGCNTART